MLRRAIAEAVVATVMVEDWGAEAEVVEMPEALMLPEALADSDNCALRDDSTEADALPLALSDKVARETEAEGDAASEAVGGLDEEGVRGVPLVLDEGLSEGEGELEKLTLALAVLEETGDAEGAESEYKGVPLGEACTLAEKKMGVRDGESVATGEREARAVRVGAEAEAQGELSRLDVALPEIVGTGDPDIAADAEGERRPVMEAVAAVDGEVDCEVSPEREADAVRHSEGVLLTERLALSGELLQLAHSVAEVVGKALVGVAEPQKGAEAVGAPSEPLGVTDAEPVTAKVCVKKEL